LCVQAVDCVRFFRGKTVAVVGEWDGDTGTTAFATVLATSFRLKVGQDERGGEGLRSCINTLGYALN
jgi:hypothetical protein